jgi:5-methyltetrahydrofolate--homocysteine methyltransferase
MDHKTFIERIQCGEILVADGATGTNLLQRGLPRGVSSENWVLTKPDQIVQLHQEFICAGAQIILSCTFGANAYRLEESSLDVNTIEINHTAVKLAHKAIDEQRIFIAGSIGPLGKLLKPYGPVEISDAEAAYAEQAQALTKAGVDFLLIETQFDLTEAAAAVRGAHTVSHLPLVVSFSFDRGKHTMMGISPTKMVKEMASLSVDVLGINCGRSLEDNLFALRELRQATDLPIWFKPNAGLPKVDEEGNTFYNLSPRTMSENVQEWITAGANVIGGCCGTTPEHLAAIAQAVRYQGA